MPELPDLPISPHPNHVTQHGLDQLRERYREIFARYQALKSAADPAERSQLALASRDLRYLEARLGTAIVQPTPGPDAELVAFGSTVTVETPDGKRQRYRIVGEDEADADAGLISHVSPLARALIGAGEGDEVVWRRPVGDVTLTVVSVGES